MNYLLLRFPSTISNMSAVFLSAVHDIIKYESKIIQTIYLNVFNENWNKIKEQALLISKIKLVFYI
jgi:hypothetical protein